MKLLIAALVIAGTFFLIRLTGYLNKFLIKRHLKWKVLPRLFPLFELIVELSVVLWTINFLFQSKSYYNIIVIGIIIIFIGFFSWFLFRDLIAGYIFRIQNNFRSGIEIQLGETSGRLIEMRATHIIIETSEGKTVKIPYSRISSEIVSEQPAESITEDSVLTLQVTNNKSLPETEEKIRKALLNSPWRLLHREPVIKLKTQNEKHFVFEIQVKTRNRKHQQYLYISLLKQFEA